MIAAVRGVAAGIGFSIALACDLITASDTAKFSQIFKKIGVVPDGEAVDFLTQRIGIARAREFEARCAFAYNTDLIKRDGFNLSRFPYLVPK